MSESPPPIPARATRPVRRATFTESKKVRLGNVIIDHALIEASQQQAEDWINAHPSIEIIQIQTLHSSMSGTTVVWYR